MPGTVKKDLYLAKSVGQLNDMAELPAKFKSTSAKLLVKTADKMLKEAQHSDMIQDEERAYVLFMKYFNVVTFLKKSSDYRKQKSYFDDLLGSKNLLSSIDKAEELSTSLKKRYDLVEAEIVAKKLSELDTVDSKPDKDTVDIKPDKDIVDRKKAEDFDSKAPVQASDVKTETKGDKTESAPRPGSLTCSQLYDLLEDRDAQLIIMDVRHMEDFQESRVNYKNVINVPGTAIKPGTTVTYIEKALPMDSMSLWKQRGNIDHIILMDANSKLSNVKLGTILQTLKDALFKYDSSVIIKSEPLVLDGGFEEFVLQYPTKCVNPVFDKLTKPVVASTQDSLMDFDYPDFEETFRPPSSGPSDSTISTSSSTSESVNGEHSGLLPRIDRSTKPKVDRSTKSNVNVASVQISKSKTGSLYPDVVTLNKPGTNKTLTSNSNVDFSKADSRATVHSSSISTAKNEDVKNTLNAQSSEVAADLKLLDEQKRQKLEEIRKLEEDYDRMQEESRRKIRQMKDEESRLSDLESMKRKQQSDVADLMRMKKNLQNDMAQEELHVEQQQQHKQLEENTRKEELDELSRKEDEKKKRQAEVNRLRMERKRKEDERTEQDRKIKEDKALEEAHERAKLEEEQRRNDIAAAAERARRIEAEDKKKTEERLLLEERLRKEKELHAELEKQKLAALEERRRQQAETDRLEMERRETLRIEKEKAERERLEREKKDREEQDRRKAEDAKRIADEKMRLLNEAKIKPKAVPSPNLQTGWEKRLDHRTNRYFYVNHNDNTTQWEPPLMQGNQKTGSYTTTLKHEPSPSKSNLKRSNSSPNVAQLMDDDELLAQKKLPMPAVNRGNKPVKRLMPVALPAKRRDLNPVYGNVSRALTGLRNLGNTCYMNSTIQCLNNTSPLVTYLLTDGYLYDINRDNKSGSLWEVTDDFAYLVKALWSGQYRCITPRDFKSVVGKQQPMFAGYEQQDSQEFLTFLLDGLHEGLNKVKTRPKISEQDNDSLSDLKAAEIAWRDHKLHNESIIVELFQGQLKSTIMCLTCRKQSVTFQAFMFLSLPIPSSNRCTLQDCLRQFAAEEKMTGSSQWKCPRCRSYRDSVKKIEIWKLPAILLIALNRFVYEGQWRTKINANVDFPVRGLDMTSFVKGPSPRPYRLYAASNHFGTLDGGHYTACCRNPITQKWYKFDDHEVYEMSESGVKTSAAYVLYYTSIELKPPEHRPAFS